MKKVLLTFILLLLSFPVVVNNVYAEEIEEKENKEISVTLSQCVDANSARFLYDYNEIKVKFVAIEAVQEVYDEELGKVNENLVNDYVCSVLTNAKNIKIVYEPTLVEEDEYGRIQAWVFADEYLVQEDLVKKGYAQIAYLYDEYLYSDLLKEASIFAKENELGIYHKEEIVETDKDIEFEKKEKDRNIFEIIWDFIVGLFESLLNFIDDLINNVL